MIDASAVVRDILGLRRSGRVHCDAGALEVRDPDTVFHALTGVEPPPDPGRWHPVDASHAERIAHRILHRDLAYGGAIMPQATALQLARRFIALAPAGASLLTNAPDLAEGGDSWAWTPATSATFDAGVLIVGEGFSAVLWVEDED